MIVEEDIYLEHYGVPGMKWGVRKKSSEKRYKQLQRKNNRLDGNRILDGAGTTGYYQKKRADKGKPSHKRPHARATAGIAARGAIEAAAIFGLKHVVVRNLPMTPEAKKGLNIATAYMVGNVGMVRTNQIINVNQARRSRKNHEELRKIERSS